MTELLAAHAVACCSSWLCPIDKFWGPSEGPQWWMHTLRSVHNRSHLLGVNRNSCDRAVSCPCRCMLWQAGPVMQTGAPAVFSTAGACCVACRLFQLVVAPQGVGDAAVAMYAAGQSLWGPFAGPPGKVHAPWGMQHPPPLARKRVAACEVLACGREPSRLNSCWGLGALLAVRCVQRWHCRRLQGQVDRVACCLENSGGLLMVPRGGCCCKLSRITNQPITSEPSELCG